MMILSRLVPLDIMYIPLFNVPTSILLVPAFRVPFHMTLPDISII